mmetsp:Transcript_161/g.301  ORF Transcript_161/g.301 Transcript_161/m.301 type:complete len:139 (+) Transcript_161:156-572(+)|eukprot:scaffold7720_cov149-Amphora_coffeaeformis.AAC.4
MIRSLLSRTAVRRLAPRTLTVMMQHQVPKIVAVRAASIAVRAASTSHPHLAGHPGPTNSSTSSNTNTTNPSEEARQAAELMRKLQEDPTVLNQIHDEQPMFVKPAGPDSLPGDREYKREKATSTKKTESQIDKQRKQN